MSQIRLWVFEKVNSISIHFTEKIKYFLFILLLLGMFTLGIIINRVAIYGDLVFLVNSTYVSDIIRIFLAISAVFIFNIAFAGIFILLFEIASNKIFGRILQSTYLASIWEDHRRMVRYINIGKMRGLLSRWHKNLHNVLTSNIILVGMYLFILIFAMSLYIGEIIFPYIPENLPRGLLWEVLLWNIGLLITILFFFVRYINTRLDIDFTIQYFPYLLVTVLSFTISIVFTVLLLTILNNSLQESSIALILTYVLLSVVFLSMIFLRIISLPLTNGLEKIQERAAKREIYKYA